MQSKSWLSNPVILSVLKFIFSYLELPGAVSFKCEERLVRDIAIVDVYYGSQFATKLNKAVTATFTDKLASIGKYTFQSIEER